VDATKNLVGPTNGGSFLRSASRRTGQRNSCGDRHPWVSAAIGPTHVAL
jgi:hypothetical protein